MVECIVDGITSEFHDGIVNEWGIKDNGDWGAVEYICRRCGATNPIDFPNKYWETMDEHREKCQGRCGPCQGILPLMNAGDAGREVSAKSIMSRVDFYKRARADGIQPNGTHPVQVEAAYKASENLGRAYDGGTMTRADKVTKSMASTINEVEKA